MNENQNETVIEMRDVQIGTMRDLSEVMLENVNWSAARGEFWVVAGPQHSGKSDFLMMTAGLMPPANGCYKFFGNETRIFDETRMADRLRMGFIFESAQLFHDLTIAENIALPLRYHKNLSLAEAVKSIKEMLECADVQALPHMTPAVCART